MEKRLLVAQKREDAGVPTLSPAAPRLEMGERVRAFGTGGIALAHRVAVQSGLVEAIDRRVHMLKTHRP